MKRSFKYRVAAYLLITVASILVLIPSVVDWLNTPSAQQKDSKKTASTILPNWFTSIFSRKIPLGLDLRGGAQLTYEVDLHKLQADRLYSWQGNLTKLLADEGKIPGDQEKSPVGNKKWQGVAFEVVDQEGIEPQLHMLFPSADLLKQAKTLFGKLDGFNTYLVEEHSMEKSNELVYVLNLDNFKKEQEQTIDKMKEIVTGRIDQFGVGEKYVQKAGQDRLLVEVPGQDLKKVEEIKNIIDRTARLEFRAVESDSDYMEKLSIYAQIEKVRLANLGLEVNNQSNEAFFLQAKNKAVLINFVKTLPKEQQPPADHEILFGEFVVENNKLSEQKWRTYYLLKRPELTGDTLTDSSVQISQDPKKLGQPEVHLTFNSVGTDIFAKVTEKYKKRQLAIILDNIVESAPTVTEKIDSGKAVISINKLNKEEAYEEAQKLVSVLRAGALPAPLKLISSTMVSATLGPETVQKAQLAMIIGSVAVILFMLIYYRGAGLIANIAMLLNVLYLLAILAFFEATLTLPGIAAVVLTVGMAVDANIIIYERIREELRSGKQPRSAVETGFNRAFWTVFDAHITNLVAGIVLYSYGTGPIKGFAVSLMIGIVCNLFTSVWLSRAMFEWIVNRKKTTSLSI